MGYSNNFQGFVSEKRRRTDLSNLKVRVSSPNVDGTQKNYLLFFTGNVHFRMWES